MSTVIYPMCFLLLTCMQDCYAQKITSFSIEPEDTACRSKNAAVMYESLLVHVTLVYNRSLDLNSWYTFDVMYTNFKLPESAVHKVTDISLRDCVLHLLIELTQWGRCLVMDDRIFLTIRITAVPQLNDVSFFGRWVSVQHGFVLSHGFFSGLRVTAKEYEYLRVDGVMQHEVVIKFDQDRTKVTPLHIEYCVQNIQKHILVMELEDWETETTGKCVEVYARPRPASVLCVGFDEVEGDCKQSKRRFFGFMPDTVDRGPLDSSCRQITFVDTGLHVLILLVTFSLQI